MKSKLRFFSQYKPAVRKVWLQLSAGLVWCGVGVMLNNFAARWLKLENTPTRFLLVMAGLALAAGIYAFGFSKLALKNIRRICALADEKVCLFAFQSWTSYPLVAFMILMGIYLRVYSPFPKPLLAVLYVGIGSALFAASLHYFTYVFRTWRSPALAP